MPHELTAEQRLHVFHERTDRYRRLGYDRVVAARFVAGMLSTAVGPALDVGTGKGLMAIELARAVTLLHDFLVSVDFGRMRAADADLSTGKTGLTVRISRAQEGSVVWEKGHDENTGASQGDKRSR